MNREYVSVENSKYHRDYYPPALDKSTASLIYPPPLRQSEADEPRGANPEIDRVLQRLSDRGLCGEAHVTQYLLYLHRRNCRPNTIRSNGSAIILFLTFLTSIGRNHLETITREEFSAFIEHEQDRGLKPRSVSTRLRSLSAFFHFLIERGVIHPNVLTRKMRIKVPDSLPRAIDPEDIKLLLSVIKTPRNRAMIVLLLRTGMRIGEVLNTKLEDVHLEEKRIDIFEAQKNRLGRVVYISDDAEVALQTWLKWRNSEERYLFYGPRGRPLCYEAARAMFHKHLEIAGLSHRGYTLHCLRHTFASELLNAGMRLECLQQLLGHRSIEMTRRYARLTDNTRKEEYFKAMALIEKGGINGHYRCDYPLP
jgi:site-specific recombinase XerD